MTKMMRSTRFGDAVQAAASQYVGREDASRLGDFAEAMAGAEIADMPLVDALSNYVGAMKMAREDDYDELYLALAEATLVS